MQLLVLAETEAGGTLPSLLNNLGPPDFAELCGGWCGVRDTCWMIVAVTGAEAGAEVGVVAAAVAGPLLP